MDVTGTRSMRRQRYSARALPLAVALRLPVRVGLGVSLGLALVLAVVSLRTARLVDVAPVTVHAGLLGAGARERSFFAALRRPQNGLA